MNQAIMKRMARKYARLKALAERETDSSHFQGREAGYFTALMDLGLFDNPKFKQFLEKELDFFKKYPESL